MRDLVSVCRQTENGVAMSGYSHLDRWERDQTAELKAAGRSVRAIAQALGRAASTISREIRRNALDEGAYRLDWQQPVVQYHWSSHVRIAASIE